MAKILNLDTLPDTNDKVLVLNGVRHSYHPFTVDEFIAQMKEAEGHEEKGPTKMSETVDYMVEVITRAFPTLPESDLRKLPVDRLKVISDFVNGLDDKDTEEAAAESGEN